MQRSTCPQLLSYSASNCYCFATRHSDTVSASRPALVYLELLPRHHDLLCCLGTCCLCFATCFGVSGAAAKASRPTLLLGDLLPLLRDLLWCIWSCCQGITTCFAAWGPVASASRPGITPGITLHHHKGPPGTNPHKRALLARTNTTTHTHTLLPLTQAPPFPTHTHAALEGGSY
jgi:hypothetical protein